jgi:hypothetical protein
MKHLKPARFRPAFGVAAAAMSAVTLTVAVALPIGFGGACADDAMLASRVPAAIEVAAPNPGTVVLQPIHVVGHRDALLG